MAIAGEMLQHGDGRFLYDRADQALAAAGDDQVDVFVELEQRRHERAVGRFDELHRRGIDAAFGQRLGNDLRDGADWNESLPCRRGG